MNARSEGGVLLRRSERLPTGLLEIELHQGADELDALLGFAARANAKRGFLFVSKVLGKHWPVRPQRMLEVHARLAAGVPGGDGPVVFIAMAETAVGLGQGVFEAWLRAHPGREALFLQTTRYASSCTCRRAPTSSRCCWAHARSCWWTTKRAPATPSSTWRRPAGA
jgi:hypothetical protein